jgi:hypothetical protein
MPKSSLLIVAAALTMLASAGGAWLATARTALAPEPARLNSSLNNVNSIAPAYYVSTNVSTSVVKFSATWVPGTVAAGTPCSSTDLGIGQDAIRVIQAYGSYRKCA